MGMRLKEILKDKDRRRGIIGTTIVHIFLLVALIFLALRTPLPLPGEEGVEVNLGYDDMGIGDVQTESPPQQSEELPPPPTQEITEPEPVIEEEEIITQDIEETTVIEEEKTEDISEDPEPEPEELIEETPEKPEKPEEIVEEIIEKPVDSSLLYTETIVEKTVPDPASEPVVNEKALFTGSSQSQSGTNQGITEGSGDQGKPHGFEESNKYDGQGGLGNGISFSLGGRGSKFLDKPTANFKEVGTVKVDIWVDRNGMVKNAVINRKGTNVVDPDMHRIAINAAKNSTFAEDPKALELQRGSITYNFILMK
jgi:outer membrane biosynthesis protein TonB